MNMVVPLYMMLSYLPCFLLRFLQDIFLFIVTPHEPVPANDHQIRHQYTYAPPPPHDLQSHPDNLESYSTMKKHLQNQNHQLPPVSKLSNDENGYYCAVCLSSVTAMEDEVRRLPNCRHVFHKGCIDTWIVDRCKTTCPLCRADAIIFSPSPAADHPKTLHHSQRHPDPWRKERMMYLFGHDNDSFFT